MPVYLWHLNRRTAPGAVALGLFVAWVPIPFQMLVAAAGALLFRVNLPLSVAMVWVSNPLTMPPLFYFAYRLGGWVLGLPPMEFVFELSWEWLHHELNHIWRPFLLGCLIMGAISSVAGYITIRLLWHMRLLNYLKVRPHRTKS